MSCSIIEWASRASARRDTLRPKTRDAPLQRIADRGDQGAATPVARTMNAPGKTGVWSFVWWYGAEARSSIVAAMSGA